jgi:hypothetical protein|tara:strand:- start:1995 stop:2390 length:396 start_codon:yes stop_codon:yes gene_type:complete
MSEETKKLTEMQEVFLDALTGPARGNIRAAMDAAGYSANTRVSEVVGPLKEEIVERSSTLLALNAPKAAFGIIGVLDDPSAMGARNAVSAAREILDRIGLVKREQIQVTGPEGGIFIMPPKKVADDPDDLD